MPKSKRSAQEDDYFACQCCGAELPRAATFCRHCGASDACGWGDDYQREALDLPTGYDEEDDGDFDYDEFLAHEFPDQAPQGNWSKSRFQTIVVVLICIGLFASALLYVWH